MTLDEETLELVSAPGAAPPDPMLGQATGKGHAGQTRRHTPSEQLATDRPFQGAPESSGGPPAEELALTFAATGFIAQPALGRQAVLFTRSPVDAVYHVPGGGGEARVGWFGATHVAFEVADADALPDVGAPLDLFVDAAPITEDVQHLQGSVVLAGPDEDAHLVLVELGGALPTAYRRAVQFYSVKARRG